MRMMLPLRDEELITNSKAGSPSSTAWLYLTAEFLIGGFFSVFVTILGILKSFLPKPPRDLTGDIVLVAGVSSSVGKYLAEEFAKDGCSVICVDNDLGAIEEIVSQLKTHCPNVEEIKPRHRKNDSPRPKVSPTAYRCDLLDQKDIRKTAEKIKDKVGRIDILVTCVGNPGQDIFDIASKTLMSHYWLLAGVSYAPWSIKESYQRAIIVNILHSTVLAFLPLLLHGDRAHVIGITPVTSSEDAYVGSRAAIASLMESVGQELSDNSGHLTFMAISPVTQCNQIRQTEQKVARDIVQAIKTDQYNLTVSWSSRILYQISCAIYNVITTITQWMYTPGCDNLL